MRALAYLLYVACTTLPLGFSTVASAQLPKETVSRPVELRGVSFRPSPTAPIDLSKFEGLYQYKVLALQRLLPLADTIARCVDTQRLVSGEFHDRLDFSLEPSGKLKSFQARRSTEQLQSCLLPHTLTLRFPPFAGQASYVLQVLVASPGVRLGRRTEPRPVAVYPLGSDEERRAYGTAFGWVASPWTGGMSDCAEWVGLALGAGYRVQLEAPVSTKGRVESARLTVTGPLAAKAAERLARCVAPFVKALKGPPHAGPAPFPYRFGSTTAKWEPD
ncbi:MAG: hypothetical protein IT371_31630 [Deltaproteobacteria bacterium]|nr:hypothetical protein [Deltaproteobacteria bacterium]